MNLQQIVAQKHQSPGGEMLLVRNRDILSTMVRIPIVVIGLVLIALSAPIQQSFGSSRTLDFTIYPDGSTHVFYELDVDPLELETEGNFLPTVLILKAANIATTATRAIIFFILISFRDLLLKSYLPITPPKIIYRKL